MMNSITKGILIGAGVSVAGLYLYKKNEEKVDDFLRKNGVKVKTPTADFKSMSIVDLMKTKEDIEDIIAEKEMEEESVTVTEEEVEIKAEEAEEVET